MIEKYDLLFKQFKQFISNNSQYNARVVKYNTKSSTYFPVITFVMSDNTLGESSIDNIDKFDNYYFTIDIYTQDKKNNDSIIASQVINDELTELTNKFFSELNMRRTLCQYTPNIDDEILRRTLRFQCSISNRGNIIRR